MSRNLYLTLTAGLAILIALLAALAGFGTRWDWWTFRTGFTLLRWAVYGAALVTVLAAVGLYLARSGPRRGHLLARFALLIGLVMVTNAAYWMKRGRSVPPIHDITTDTERPPEFVAIAPLRADAPNPSAYGGPEVAAQQRAAYPDLQPMHFDLPVSDVFQRALEAARESGWEIVAQDPAAGRIEATDRTFWFGFADDIVIRITPDGARTRVDVRSVSRVGRGDVGTNARRVRNYLRKLAN